MTDTDLVTIEEVPRRLGAVQPKDTIELATSMANALTDIVEKKRLFATISGKKFPTVEAWMTIARMDNVVAREVHDGVRQQDDGSFEAQVELIRLSDGMIVGHGSALCGTPGDKPWDSRALPQRRSMAVTRATSRAFRQQYSWIMALAGYEPTPAEEMPTDAKDVTPRGSGFVSDTPFNDTTHDGGLIGTAEIGKARTSDWEVRKSGDDDHFVLGFRLTNGRKGYNVLTRDELALQLADLKDSIAGQRVTVWGKVADETFEKNGKTIVYQIVHAERMNTPKGSLPVSPLRDPEDEVLAAIPVADGQVPAFDLEESARLDAEEAAAAG